jgi:hypothetical protein
MHGHPNSFQGGAKLSTSFTRLHSMSLFHAWTVKLIDVTVAAISPLPCEAAAKIFSKGMSSC